MPKEDTIRIDLTVHVSPDFWDATCCVLTAAAFWPYLGLGQAVKGKIKDWQYWLGLLPFVALIGAIIQVGDASSTPPSGFIQDPDNEDHAYREEKLNLPNDASFGKLTLHGAHPLDDPTTLQATGIFLYGGMEIFSPPQPELANPVLEPICWDKAGHCSRRVAAGTRFRLDPVNPKHWALLQVCEVRVIDDPLNVYHVAVVRELHGLPDVVLSVDFWSLKADYWLPQYHYGCRLMIKTTGGVRIVTFPPLHAVSAEQFQELMRQIQFEFVNECYLPRHRLFEELDWPIEVLVEQPGLSHWQVRAVGLEPGERVNLVDERQGVVGRFTVNRNGALLVSALGRLQGSQPVLRLQRSSGGGRGLLPRMPSQTLMDIHAAPAGFGIGDTVPQDSVQQQEVHGHQAVTKRALCPPESHGSLEDMVKVQVKYKSLLSEGHQEESRGVIVRQTLLEERGHIRLPDACLSLTLDTAEGRPRLVALTEGLAEAYDLSDPMAPQQMGGWRTAEARGAVAFAGRLIFWGEPGLWLSSDAPPERTPFSRCESDAVRGAAVLGDRLFVLHGDDLRIYGPDLCEQRRHHARGAEQIATAGDHVVLRNREGLLVFHSQAGSPENAALLPLRGAVHVETTAFTPARDAIYVRTGRRGVVLQLSGDGEPPHRLAEYEGRAWFEGFLRAGRTLAYLSDDRQSVHLLEATRSVQSE